MSGCRVKGLSEGTARRAAFYAAAAIWTILRRGRRTLSSTGCETGEPGLIYGELRHQRADLPLIDLHDVRPSYATAGGSWDAKIGWKALSQRIGHSDVAFTMRQYVQPDLETDRQVATVLAELIIGGMLASVSGPPEQGKDPRDDAA